MLSLLRRNGFLVAFLFILLLASALRLFQLGVVPHSLYWDEAAMYVDVKSVLETGRDMHGRPWYQVIYPSYGDYKLPVYLWLAELSGKVFGLSEMSLKLPSALAGVGTVVVAGWIARELFEQKKRWHAEALQLLTMFTVAVSPWSMMFSRTAFEGHVGQFFLAASILCFLKAKKWPILLLLSPVLGAVATYTYFSVRFVWVAVFVACAILMMSRWPKQSLMKFFSKALQMVVLPLVFFGVLLIPMFRSPLYAATNALRLGTDSVLRDDTRVITSNIYREMAGNTPVDRVIFHRWWFMIQELMKNYSDNLSLNFLFISGDPNLRHGTTHHGLFLLVFLPALGLGVYTLFRDHRSALAVVVVWWMVALLPASVPQTTPHALRSLNALVPVAMIIGAGLTAGMQWLLSLHSKVWKLVVGSGVVVLMTLSILTFAYHYFTVYPLESADSWQDGYRELAQTIYAHVGSDENVYIQQFDDRFYLWMMGYGPYTGHDFQSWHQTEFLMYMLLPHVKFGNFEFAELSRQSGVWYVGQAATIRENVNFTKVSESFEVRGADGKTPRFMLVKTR